MKVMVFGTFDVIHAGHRYFLSEAKKLGDELVVVIGTDSFVAKKKRKKPYNDQETRRDAVEATKIPDRVIIGDPADPFAIVWKESPDIICLGYDQDSMDLEKAIVHKKKNIIVKRIGGYKPDRFKSSLLKRRLNL